jgi:predicted transcriptional regulator
MSSGDFTRLLQARNLWRNNIGIDGYLALGKLIEAPVIRLAKSKNKTPSTLKGLSLLLAQNLATLSEDRTQYEVTELGREWHAAVTSALKGAK